MIEKCELWESSRIYAKARGLGLTKNCPMENICVGERCFYISPIKKLIESANNEEEQRIASIRIELAKLNGALNN